jgi:hypothetical protein
MRKNLKRGDIVMRKIHPDWGGSADYAAIYLISNPNVNSFLKEGPTFSAIVLHTFVKNQNWYVGQKHQVDYKYYDPETLTIIW